METRTITIKSFEKTSGKKKDGTEWNRTSIKATDGKFYSSFSPIFEDALVAGTELKILVEQSKVLNTYDIKKVISYIKPKGGEGTNSPATSLVAVPLASQLNEADSYAKELLSRATQLAHKENPEWESASEYPYLIATLVQVMHGHITNIEIAAQDEKKYKMWGKKW
jgi:hypothetical protein